MLPIVRALRHGRDPVEPARRRLADRAGTARAARHRARAGRAHRRPATTCRCPENQRKLDAVEQLAQLAEEAGHHADRAGARVRAPPSRRSRRRSSARARWSSSKASSARPTSSSRDDVLDRIDEIVPPGVNLNPADAGWHNPDFGAGGATALDLHRPPDSQ